jgi:serine/threonine-protein kinase
VYRATDLMLGRTIAVKVLLAALADEDPTYVARFEREARAAAALTHRAVVTVYDAGVDDGERFIAMEYVDGRTLAETLRGGPLNAPEAIRIAREVAGALAAAHAAGILHRDIKPANVMVTAEGAVKVLDFGVARPLDGTTLTQAASIVGTAAYMAPERALGDAGDARSDIYSLGCLLYAMLTGRPPFTGEHSAAILHQHINTDPRPPSRVAPGVPEVLDALVLAMLAKASAARPQTAAEVRDRLVALEPTGLASALPLPAATSAAVALDQTSATRVMSGRQPSGLARRAALAAILTAAIALGAIALFGGGGSQSVTTSTAHGTTTGAQHQTTSTPATSTQGTTPSPPLSAAPPGPAGQPPGHEKKKEKKHGHDDGGD